MILCFSVHEQTVIPLGSTSVPRGGSSGYLQLSFEFDESWDKFPASNGSRTIFFQKDKKFIPVVLDESGIVDVPPYFTATDEGFMIMLVGISGSVACPTNAISILLEPGGEAWRAEPADLNIPAYQQLVALAQQAVASAAEALELVANFSLPVARGKGEDGIAYVAAGEKLPTVKPGSGGRHVGKGKQIIFIPDRSANKSEYPTLQINGGEAIPIRMRAPKNRGEFESNPDATLPVPVGALMVGVPYTMTFCGLYWLIDSQITQYACADDAEQAELLRNFAAKLMLLYEGDTIGMPIINSVDGVGTAKAIIKRSAEEDASPDVSGNVMLPTEARVKEMTEICVVNMTKNADGACAADKTFAELKAAHDAGRTVICSFRDLSIQQWFVPCRLPVVDTSNAHIDFAGVIEPRQNYKIFAQASINKRGMGYTATELRDLPKSTTDDNGKVLTVADGDPVWTDKSHCIVNMTKNADGTYTADKTFSELKAAHDAGRTVICSFNDLTQQWFGPCRLPVVGTSDAHIGFAGVIEPSQDYKIFAQAYINKSGMGYTAMELRNLPESTTADNGKVLTVSGGLPAWKDKSPCIVNMTKNADGTYTADKTFSELKAAHDAGRTVICSFNDLTQQWFGPCRLPVVGTSDAHIGFAGVIEPSQDYKIFAQAYINKSGMGYTATELRNLPESTTDDNGKVLTVSGGLPVWKDKSHCIVNMVKNADGTYTADKTFAELKAAHDAGRTVICSFNDLTQQWFGPCRLPLMYLSDTGMGFAAVVTLEQDYMAYVWAYINSHGMGHTATELRNLPESTTDDNGKVLTVSGGLPVWKTNDPYVDVTAGYNAWVPESGAVKTVENYTKTLQDGRYYVYFTDLDMHYYVDILTVGATQWRTIRSYLDESFCVTVYRDSGIAMKIDQELATVEINGTGVITTSHIPLPSKDDKGKVLMATGAGAAAWTAVTNAEEVAV